ncbi:hypothetical protein VE26_05680 [Devosia chinhatensis]|uniref:MPN domain-containing protein n=1 Tax=Devosia chinhatensis TaxID=429727 RepID=A0A0F5FN92_9HYPH|nr:hypothetical protein VE26_05680 [Devosia chinhatensis]
MQKWPLERQSQLLAQLLLQSLGAKRAKEVSLALIARFGSLPAAIAAPVNLLVETPGVGRASAELFGAIREVAIGMARLSIDDCRPIIASWSQLVDYCRITMAFEQREQTRLIFLDKKNRLIADEVQQMGTVDQSPVYPREVIGRTLELSASALILVHNHPSGDPSPSAQDVRTTKEIAEIASLIGITVHDHIIIGKAGYKSLRQLKLI